MKVPTIIASACFVFALSSSAFAEAKFVCDSGDPKSECAFTVFDGHGVIGFVLAPGATHGLNDNTIGQKFCVTVTPKNSGARNVWPQCWDQSRPAPDGHKIVNGAGSFQRNGATWNH
jgi:hypothetical protein